MVRVTDLVVYDNNLITLLNECINKGKVINLLKSTYFAD